MGPGPITTKNPNCYMTTSDSNLKGWLLSQWRIQGGRTPPFGPRCRLFNIGPKVGPPLGPPPPFFACRPKMDPPFKNPGSAPVSIGNSSYLTITDTIIYLNQKLPYQWLFKMAKWAMILNLRKTTISSNRQYVAERILSTSTEISPTCLCNGRTTVCQQIQ